METYIESPLSVTTSQGDGAPVAPLHRSGHQDELERRDLVAIDTAIVDDDATSALPKTQRAAHTHWKTSGALLATDLAALAIIGGSVDVIAANVAGVVLAPVALSMGVVGLLCAYGLFGLYGAANQHPAEEMHRMSVISLFVLGTWATGISLAGYPAAAAATGGMAVLVAGLAPVARMLARMAFSRAAWWGVPAVVLGAADHGQAVINTLKKWPELGIRPVVLLQDDEAADSPDDIRRGRLDEATAIAEEERIPYAIVALPAYSYPEQAQLLLRLGKFYERVFVVPDRVGAPALWVMRNSCSGLMGYGIQHYRFSRSARWTKRTLDVVGATIGIVVALPILLTIAALIKIDAPGSVFFRQLRMTREGRIFSVLKFRTMYTDAEERLQEILSTDEARRLEYQTYHKLEDDPRVTRVGRWLRKASLDELPQLWNVLKGEMSLVGPRAYMPGELPKMNGLSQVVLQCPPGITGLWQVSGRNKLDFDTRVNLDVHYVHNWTVWLDLYLLIRTVPVVLSGEGAK